MTAAEIQARQIAHRLDEARDAIELGGRLIEEARDMCPDHRAAWLRTSETKLRGIWEEVGRIAEGESPVAKPSANGDRPVVGGAIRDLTPYIVGEAGVLDASPDPEGEA